MTSAPESEAEPRPPFTQIVEKARSGLRRDVLALVEALEEAELLVPLARDIPGAELGERRSLDGGELTLVPHLLPDAEGQLFAAVFTHPEPLEPIVAALEWSTEEDELKLCSLPARLAFEMARDVIDEENVLGLVIDAGSDSELCLTRAEVASILGGRALPLLAYVAQIPADERERTLIAESEAPSPELVAVLDAFRAVHPEVLLYRLERTFNADRDLEPHPTLTLRVEPSADKTELFRLITAQVEGLLPPPGYLDVLFEAAS